MVYLASRKSSFDTGSGFTVCRERLDKKTIINRREIKSHDLVPIQLPKLAERKQDDQLIWSQSITNYFLKYSKVLLRIGFFVYWL